MNRSIPVRLLFDASRCDGHAICALRCPELISLDEWGYAAVDPTPVSGATAVRARRAVRACPAGALALVEQHARPQPGDARIDR